MMVSVLIVDDHRHLVESLVETVPWASLGVANVAAAYSGSEALETIRRTKVDILITDIRMPGMSGLELIERARALRSGIECILLTGYAEFDYAVKAIELRTFRYLLKPVRTNELVECVRSLAAGLPPATSAAPEDGLATPAPGAHQRKLVGSIEKYIAAHLGEDVTLAAIADAVHLHPVYVSKFYKEATGKNVSEYILSARIERAKELLTQSTMKIYEIGEQVGYRSAQHFISEFRKAVGVTPKAYQTAKR
jgi:YesN/AraC family two-component response regulator